jgi:hypothetical protein
MVAYHLISTASIKSATSTESRTSHIKASCATFYGRILSKADRVSGLHLEEPAIPGAQT